MNYLFLLSICFIITSSFGGQATTKKQTMKTRSMFTISNYSTYEALAATCTITVLGIIGWKLWKTQVVRKNNQPFYGEINKDMQLNTQNNNNNDYPVPEIPAYDEDLDCFICYRPFNKESDKEDEKAKDKKIDGNANNETKAKCKKVEIPLRVKQGEEELFCKHNFCVECLLLWDKVNKHMHKPPCIGLHKVDAEFPNYEAIVEQIKYEEILNKAKGEKS